MVVQPNVITHDEKAGVQFGELVRVTRSGCESLHRIPHDLFRAGQTIPGRNSNSGRRICSDLPRAIA